MNKFNNIYKKILIESDSLSHESAIQYSKEALNIINHYVQSKSISKLMRDFKIVSKLTQLESITDNFKNTAAGRLLIFLRTGGETTLFKSNLESVLVKAIAELNAIVSKEKEYKLKNF